MFWFEGVHKREVYYTLLISTALILTGLNLPDGTTATVQHCHGTHSLSPTSLYTIEGGIYMHITCFAVGPIDRHMSMSDSSAYINAKIISILCGSL